jgi:hypothetical protein
MPQINISDLQHPSLLTDLQDADTKQIYGGNAEFLLTLQKGDNSLGASSTVFSSSGGEVSAAISAGINSHQLTLPTILFHFDV